MLRHFFRGLCSNSNGRVLVASAIGVLVGVEHLLSTQPRTSRPVAKQPQPDAVRARPSSCCFKIRRTQSEIGYTYWVLQGFGKYQSFALFDTWQEAMVDANRRLSAAGVFEEQLTAVSI